MSLPLLHAGRTNPGLSAALDLRFALDKSLTAYRGPTPSFSRASTGSYFDASGVLRYQGYNLCQYSEDFTNAFWNKSLTSVSSNVAIAPNGQQTADKIIESASAGYHSVSNATFNLAASSTASVYLKAGERGFASVEIVDNFRAVINLSDGTVVSNTLASSTITTENAGNGWWRVKYTTNSSNLGRVIIYPLPTSTFGSYTGDGTSGIFAWGVQVETGATANQYSQTTNSANSGPRFNHTFNGTSWVSRGLLVEEQRTNSFQYSEDLSNAYWAKVGLSISANSTSAPDGNTTADKVVENASGGIKYGVISGGFSVVSGTTYTFSAYAKDSGRYFTFATNSSGFPSSIGAVFNLTNGTISSIQANTTATIQNVGSGWYRCVITGTANASITTNINFGITNNLNQLYPSYTGDGTSGYFLWGLQMESGSFPTSYIGTTNSSVVRSADVCQITGTDFSGIWNGAEGSFAAEIDLGAPVTGITYYPFYFGASDTATNTKRLFYFSDIPTGTSSLYLSDGTTTSKVTTSNIPGNFTTFKAAMCYKVDDLAISLNGAAVVTDTSQPIPTGLDRLQIGSNPSANNFNGHIARLRYYNKRLPNATLQLLSEPDPTLNLQFALNKTLTPVAGPAPSFSRASTGTFFNASGVLTSASINTPRFDHVYSGGQWVSRGLLVEEQRTNLAIYSEDLTNGVWVKANGATITADSTTAPDGNSTADRVNVTDPSHYIYKQNQSITNGVANTQTIYFKNGPGSNFTKVGFLSNVVGSYRAFVLNLSTGLTEAYPGIPFPSAYSATSIGNGWYRLSFTDTATGAAANCFYIDSAVTMATGSFYLWGAQVEAGSFATSYIPCLSSSSVTRSADVCQITGTSFGWMWNQGEGSVVAEYDKAESATSASATLVLVGTRDSSGSTNAFYYEDFDGKEWLSNWPQNVHIDTGATSTILTPAKVSFVYKANDYAVSRNGLSVLTDTIASVPSSQAVMEIGSVNNGNYWNGHIAKLIYYPARLTNTKLQQLST